jgi:hypothetical protein
MRRAALLIALGYSYGTWVVAGLSCVQVGK